MKSTLLAIAKKFNDHNIMWGIGGSLMLKNYGIVDKCNDIDLIVDVKDYKMVDKILSDLGIKEPVASKANYGTKHFSKYIVNGVEVDIIAEFIIYHDEGQYEYIFDNNSICKQSDKGIELPYTKVEDWYILYLLMEREQKAVLIEQYLSDKMVDNILVERALNQPLPNSLKVRVSSVLKY